MVTEDSLVTEEIENLIEIFATFRFVAVMFLRGENRYWIGKKQRISRALCIIYKILSVNSATNSILYNECLLHKNEKITYGNGDGFSGEKR